MFNSKCNATFLLGERRKVNDSSRGSTPPPERSNSPPIPTIRRSKGDSSSNSEFESGSIYTASEDDQVFLNYLVLS